MREPHSDLVHKEIQVQKHSGNINDGFKGHSATTLGCLDVHFLSPILFSAYFTTQQLQGDCALTQGLRGGNQYQEGAQEIEFAELDKLVVPSLLAEGKQQERNIQRGGQEGIKQGLAQESRNGPLPGLCCPQSIPTVSLGCRPD